MAHPSPSRQGNTGRFHGSTTDLQAKNKAGSLETRTVAVSDLQWNAIWVCRNHPFQNVVQAHRWRKRLGLRCLTVRVNDRVVRHLIGTGYFSLESKEDTTAIAINLEAWIYDNIL
jgi:hypothetical protein